MITCAVKILLGVLLVFSSFQLTIRHLKDLLEKLGPRFKTFATILPVVTFVLFEAVGVHLSLDPFIRGEPIIHVHAEDLVRKDQAPYELRVEIAVLNCGGSVDPQKRFTSKFDGRGTYPVLVDLGWFQSYVRVKVFRQTKEDQPIFIRFQHVPLWSRLGLSETDVYVEQ